MNRYSMKCIISSRSIMLALACGWAGCGANDKLDLGDNVDVTNASLRDYSGTWSGYAEAYKFRDGSDRVDLELDAEGNGTLKFGNTTLPAPTSDKAYPADDVSDVVGGYNRSIIAAGFAYQVAQAVVVDSRIRFDLSSTQLYQDWCALMTPVLDTTSYPSTDPEMHYRCLPPAVYVGRYPGLEDGCEISAATGPLQVNCGLTSCLRRCACNANSCSPAEPNMEIALDGSLETNGDSMVGTLVLFGERVTVRLRRQ
jgi:hypothetical protein